MDKHGNNAFRIILAIVVIGVVVTIISINRDRTDDELAGVWKLETTQTNGQPQRRERELWVFRDGTLTIVRDNGAHHARISIDPSASPKHLDTDTLFRPTGIYEMDGRTLRVSQVVPNRSRPTEFKTTQGDLCTVSVLNRLDVDPRLSTEQLQALLLSEFGPATEYPEHMDFDEGADKFISNLLRNLYDRAGEMTGKEEVVCRVSFLIAEVNNGGFHQYFANPTGESAVKTAAWLREIGAPQTATLVETGCQLFPEGAPSQDHQERRGQLERFTLDQLETLRDLDERFYSRREDLNLLLKKYWEGEP